MGVVTLTDKNFELYAIKAYSNPQCTTVDEFYDDIKRIKYIKRLLNRYEQTGEMKERLLLNHIVVLYNVFGINAATRILFFKLEESFWPTLKTFLVYLEFMPDRIENIQGREIISSDIAINVDVVNRLRKI